MLWIHGMVFVLLLLMLLPGIRRKVRKKLELAAPPEVLTGALIILLAGNILGTVVTVLDLAGNSLKLTQVEQENQEGQEQTVTLETRKGDGSRREVGIIIPGQTYSKKEIQRWFREGRSRLKEAILGENRSLNHVNTKLNLISAFSDLPIEIGWGSSDPAILDWEGNPGDDIPERGTEVTLYVTFTCQEESEDHSLTVRVYPPEYDEEERWEREAQDTFLRLNKEEKDDKVWRLPSRVSGEAVTWHRPLSRIGPAVLLLAFAMALVWILGKKQEKREQKRKRQEEMTTDYPEILNKFVLLLNAGMNTRKAFGKVALDYRRQKEAAGETFSERAAYEEISQTYLEMEQGVPEAEAYERMGRRCGLSVYKTFATLLVQNLRKGNREILDMLERESQEAFENRKRRAKILGEQAGTKLLAPMMLMLVIVFVILLYPAGSSFVI